jgi:hypothetical protein
MILIYRCLTVYCINFLKIYKFYMIKLKTLYSKGALLFEEDSGYLLREITFCDRNFLENLVSIQICRLPGIMLLHREGQSQ